MMLRIVLLEIQDILDLGSTERIDGLRIITDDTDVLMELTELLQDEILGEIRILILIDHYVVESSCYRLQRSRIVAQQYVHIQQDIIKIHDTRHLAFICIQIIDVHDTRLLCRRIILQGIGVASVCRRSDQVVLRHGYTRKHILRLVYLVIKLQLLQAGLYGADRIAGIIDREGRRVSQ